MRARVILFVLLAAGVPGLTSALTLSELDVNVGLLFIGSAPPPTYGGPSPITQSFGVSFVVQAAGPLFFEPSIEFFGTYYEWTGARAVPTGYESGTGFFTVGSLIGLHAGMMYPVATGLEMGGALGVDFLIRFPLEFQNTAADTGDGLNYFYSQGRFIFPETRFITRWHVTDGVTLVFTLRGMYPLFHLWDGESLPFYDQLMAAFDLGFAISLGGKRPPATPAQSPPPQTAPAPAK
ncbi:MAG TPA: hypothetical protein VMU36_06455 [Spirochaetia bacterium]|nr:hypothetical protein [Spirochaetia bacterium]